MKKFLPPVLLFAIAAAIGLAFVSQSGALWPDGPKYTNAGALFYDLLRSGQYTNWFDFVKANYAQYPAIAMPFHPPGYPAMLGVFFLLTGVSYTAARVFVALCAGVAASAFYGILRRWDIDRPAAWLCSVLLLTTPVVVRWTRSTMSELPCLAFLLIATCAYLRWCETNRARDWWLTVALVQVAYLCRVTAAGVLPGWALYLVLTGRWRRLLTPQVIAGTLVFLAISLSHVKLAARYASFEVAMDGKAEGFSRQNIEYFLICMPKIALTGSGLAAAAGLLVFLRRRKEFELGLFWLCWLGSYTLFKLAVSTTYETRHFFVALPALAGLAACLFSSGSPARRRWAIALVAAASVVNLAQSYRLPAGLVGYQPVAELLSRQTKRGNVLLCCHQEADLIFRYRACSPGSNRLMLRGDRTLVVTSHAKKTGKILAGDEEEMLETLQRGRVRYLVTWSSEEQRPAQRTFEMRLAHGAAQSRPQDFRLLETYPLMIHFSPEAPGLSGEIFVWEYLGELPPGKSELAIPIPTAQMILQPDEVE